MVDTEPIHFYCLVQNRLGAIDRVIGALTHRGILPERLSTSPHADQALEMRISFILQEEKAVAEKLLEKLTRFLQKQVYVLEAYAIPPQKSQVTEKTETSNVITPSFVSDVITDHTQRRTVNAHNA